MPNNINHNKQGTVKHLGALSGPLLIFGGPYSNLQALEAIQQEAEQRHIPPENCICTGDIVAYCGQAKETVAAIRDWGVHCLMGNCEESLAQSADDCGCGFEEGSSCDILSAQWYPFAHGALGPSERQWFSTLPEQIHFSLNGLRCVVIHGSVSSINQFIFPSTDNYIFAQELALSQADMVIGGHCGIPFTRTTPQQCWHNAGAIGMPANDGCPHTWFSIIEPSHTLNKADLPPTTIKPNAQLTIHHLALHYDHQQAFNRMQEVNMHNGYADALLSGLWPSMDVLPPTEQQARNKPLPAITYQWPAREV